MNTTNAELVTVNPAELRVSDQVRSDATPDEQLIESVARFGIQQPPTVVWNPHYDAYEIAIGHRRVGAAIAAGLTEILVISRDRAETDALKLEQQIVENERRKGLTPGELARGYADLQTLFGQTPEEIAASLSEPVDRVRAGIKAARATRTSELIADEPSIDLEQAALIADFEGRDDVQDALLLTALRRPAEFQSAVIRQREADEAETRATKLRAAAERENVTVVDERSYDNTWWTGNHEIGYGGSFLADLDIRPEQHTECPGHGVVIMATNSADLARLEYVCTNYRENGHTRATAAAPARELTAEEIEEEARRDKEREAAEQQRQALAANSLARRDWLRGFLKGRLNQTVGIFDLIAESTIGLIIHDDFEPWSQYTIATGLLRGEEVAPPAGRYYSSDSLNNFAELVVSGEVTALRALVAHALAVCESAVESSDRDSSTSPRLVPAYFDHLVAWGYEPTDLDWQIISAALADGIQVEEDDDETDAGGDE